MTTEYNSAISRRDPPDPGGAAKADVTTQFFFGDSAADQADQTRYLLDHGIIDNQNGTYTITNFGLDFHYFVQVGNKGAWSEANVDVTRPAHTGPAFFADGFDFYTSVQSTRILSLITAGLT